MRFSFCAKALMDEGRVDVELRNYQGREHKFIKCYSTDQITKKPHPLLPCYLSSLFPPHLPPSLLP